MRLHPTSAILARKSEGEMFAVYFAKSHKKVSANLVSYRDALRFVREFYSDTDHEPTLIIVKLAFVRATDNAFAYND